MLIVNENIVSKSVKSEYIVSAIVSTYNSVEFIEGKLNDLLNQSIGSSLEIVIINSNSNQNEDEIIRRYIQTNNNITYIVTDQTETIYAAWNRGIKYSKGKYITNSNTDDRLKDDGLEVLINVLENNQYISLAYADQYISSVPNQTFSEMHKGKRFNRIHYSRIKGLFEYIPGPQSVWRSSLHFEKNIWFNDKYEIAGDYDFACKVAEISHFIYVNKVLGSYYKSLSQSNKEYQNIEKTLNEVENIKIFYSEKYISNLNRKEIDSLKTKCTLITKIPHIIYVVSNICIAKLAPSYRFPDQNFFAFLLVLCLLKEGERFLAKQISSKFKFDNYITNYFNNRMNSSGK